MNKSNRKSFTETTKNHRLSLNPTKPINHNQRNHNTELQMRQNSQEQSQSSISTNQPIPQKQLEKVFTTISKNNQTITVQDLYALLQDEGYNQSLYSAVQMVALVDEKRKGYITQKEFVNFFSTKNYINQQRQPALTRQMESRKQWVKQIDEHWQSYNDFLDINFCKYFNQKIGEYQNNEP